jgi:HAD superfamily hydrolase (TIGR01509 family)
MSLFNPELVIFDCDGVLVDSEIVGIQKTLDILKKYGCNISQEDYLSSYCGMDWNGLMDRIKEEYNIIIPETARYDFLESLYQSFKYELKRIDGSLEVISQLRLPVCICSNSGVDQIHMMLNLVGLGQLFTHNIFSAVELGAGLTKPKPDIFLAAAEYFHISPLRTLVVEDSVPGVTAAKSAGMYTVGFTGGAHTYPQHAERLLAVGADVIISSMYDLLSLIGNKH